MRVASEEGRGKTISATFELVVVGGSPRPGTRFFGQVVRGMVVEAETQLTDPGGTGIYTGSARVERGAKWGVGVVVRYEGLSDLVGDFGLVVFDRDRTFSGRVRAADLYRL